MSWHQGTATSPFNQMNYDQALEYAREFIDSPIHRPFSEGLQRILNRFHGRPLEGRYVLIQTKAWQQWSLARLQGRAKPVQVFEDEIFTSLEDGERAIFRRCWKEETGQDLPF